MIQPVKVRSENDPANEGKILLSVKSRHIPYGIKCSKACPFCWMQRSNRRQNARLTLRT